ncbi:MAG: hypothetical protein ACKVOW_17730 [Chitinophagaceae bacterium]
MQQLIGQLASEYNLTKVEATGIIDMVKNYVPENDAGDKAKSLLS